MKTPHTLGSKSLARKQHELVCLNLYIVDCMINSINY